MAICLADAVDAAGDELPFAPRTMLKRQVAVAQEAGFQIRLATELEFNLFWWNDPREARRLGFQGLESTTPARST